MDGITWTSIGWSNVLLEQSSGRHRARAMRLDIFYTCSHVMDRGGTQLRQIRSLSTEQRDYRSLTRWLSCYPVLGIVSISRQRKECHRGAYMSPYLQIYIRITQPRESRRNQVRRWRLRLSSVATSRKSPSHWYLRSYFSQFCASSTSRTPRNSHPRSRPYSNSRPDPYGSPPRPHCPGRAPSSN